MTVRSTTLNNGMTVLTDDMPHLESASLGIWVKAGSRSESEAEHGISHMLEHMAFKGTRTRDSLQIAATIENVGGDLNAATSVEHTGYFARVLKEDVALAGDILSDILQNSLFESDEIEREQQVIVQEIGAARDNPDDHVFDLFQQAAFPDQAIGRTILGTVESVKSFGPDAIRAYMDRNYVGDQMVLCAAGNVDHDALVDIANDRFHALRRDGAPPPEKAAYVGGEQRLVSDHEQAHIVLGMEGRAYNSDGFYAVQILASILGGGMSSRLFQNIREKQGLAYSVFSELNPYTDTGCLAVYAGTSIETLRQVIDSVLKEFSALKNEPVPAEELRRAKDHLKGSLMLGLESTSSRMSNLARQQMHFARFFSLDELVESIEKVKAEDLQRIAVEFFDQKLVALSVLGNLGDFKVTREDLVC